MDGEKIQLLLQLVDNLDHSSERLEMSYNMKDVEAFSNTQKEIIDLQNKITHVLG